MAITINNNDSKYDLWSYAADGVTVTGPNNNNIYIKQGIKNLFCVSVSNRMTSFLPNGVWTSVNCDGETINASGNITPPVVVALSQNYGLGVDHYPISLGSIVKFWYRAANNGSGGFIEREIISSNRFPVYQNGFGYSSDLVLYKFNIPLPVDADYAILPVFDDKYLWRKNKKNFRDQPGVFLDQDGRMIPGCVKIIDTGNNIVYNSALGDDINSQLNLANFAYTFISDLNAINDGGKKKQYLNFLEETGKYYDDIFRAIRIINGDSSRPSFEIDIEDKMLLLYGLASTANNSEDPSWEKSQNNYDCGVGGAYGRLISTCYFGIDYKQNESTDVLLLGSEISSRENVLVRTIDSDYVNSFYVGFDTISPYVLGNGPQYELDSRYLYEKGIDMYYVIEGGFRSDSLGSSVCYPDGNLISSDLRGTFKASNLNLFLTDKYGSFWNVNSDKILNIDIYDTSYGPGYGNISVIGDFNSPIDNSLNYSDFINSMSSSEYLLAKRKIRQFILDIKVMYPNLKITWQKLINFNTNEIPRISNIISSSDQYWSDLDDIKKNDLFDRLDEVYGDVLDLLDVVSYEVIDHYKKNDAGYEEKQVNKINLISEYIKRFFNKKQIKCPKIIAVCDTTLGYDYEKICYSNSEFQLHTPMPKNRFTRLQVLPVIKSGCDGFMVRNRGIVDKLYRAYYANSSEISLDDRDFIRRHYICSDLKNINISSCETVELCETGSSISYATTALGIIRDYIMERIGDLNANLVFKKTNNELSLCVNYKINPWDENSQHEIQEHFNLNKNLYYANQSYINPVYGSYIDKSSFIYDPVYESSINWDPFNYVSSTYDKEISYSTGNIVRYFVDEINRWVVFRALDSISVGEYPGKKNYINLSGSNQNGYFYTNIGIKWETRDLVFLHNHYSSIKVPINNISNNHSYFYETKSKNIFYISDDSSMFNNVPLYEACCFLFHNQGNIVNKRGKTNYNLLGNFAADTGNDNYGFAHKIVNNDSYINAFFSSYGSLLKNNVGIVSDFVYWYKYLSPDQLKLDYSSLMIDQFMLNYDLSYGKNGFENYDYPIGEVGVEESNITNIITRHHIFNFIGKITHDINSISKYNSSYHGHSKMINFDCGILNNKNLHSRSKASEDSKIVDVLKKNISEYGGVYSWDSMENKFPETFDNKEYYRVSSLPKSIWTSSGGIYDSIYETSHGIKWFSDNNDGKFQINNYNIYSKDSDNVKFTVLSVDANKVVLQAASSSSAFVNGLGISNVSLTVDGSNVNNWLCDLEISFQNTDSFNYFKNNFSHIYINRLHGHLLQSSDKFVARWIFSKNGINWDDTNPINTFNPSALFYILDTDKIDNFELNSVILINISMWRSGNVYKAENKYYYSSKSIKSLDINTFDMGYFNYKMLLHDNSDYSINQYQCNYSENNQIKDYIDANHYETFKKYFNIIDKGSYDLLTVDVKPIIMPLWMSRYGIEDPIFRCNIRQTYKNMEYTNTNSYMYNGFTTHEEYGNNVNGQSYYESYADSVRSFLKIAKSYNPNVKIAPTFYCRHYKDVNFMSCLYHPKELCYYLIKPWLSGNNIDDFNFAQLINISENFQSLIKNIFTNNQEYSEIFGFRLGIYMAIFNGNIPSLPDSEFNGSSNFDWDSLDRGGMLWNNYGENAMNYLSYNSLNGVDSRFGNKKKIEIFIKKLIDFYTQELFDEIKLLLDNPYNYNRPSDASIGYGKVKFINNLSLSANNELKIEFNGVGLMSWKRWKVQWYKSFKYADDANGFDKIFEQEGSGYKQFIYAPQNLISTLDNGDVIKIKLIVDNYNGINFGYSEIEEVYFENISVDENNIYIPSQKMISRNQNVIKVI